MEHISSRNSSMQKCLNEMLNKINWYMTKFRQFFTFYNPIIASKCNCDSEPLLTIISSSSSTGQKKYLW